MVVRPEGVEPTTFGFVVPSEGISAVTVRLRSSHSVTISLQKSKGSALGALALEEDEVRPRMMTESHQE